MREIINDSEDWEEKAIEILERFLEGMKDNRIYTIPVSELDETFGYIDETWTYVYTSVGQRLATRMIDRLNRLAVKVWGFDIAFSMEIKSHLYQEE